MFKCQNHQDTDTFHRESDTHAHVHVLFCSCHLTNFHFNSRLESTTRFLLLFDCVNLQRLCANDDDRLIWCKREWDNQNNECRSFGAWKIANQPQFDQFDFGARCDQRTRCLFVRCEWDLNWIRFDLIWLKIKMFPLARTRYHVCSEVHLCVRSCCCLSNQ